MAKRHAQGVNKPLSFVFKEQTPDTHQCYWYIELKCQSLSGGCVTQNAPHIICPIKPGME